MSKVRVFLSIINYSVERDTIDCLNSLRNLNKNNLDLNVVLIDNSSTDELKIKHSDFDEFGLKIIKTGSNLGFSGGHNRGIKYSLDNNADYLLILNNDTRIDKDLLKNLVDGSLINHNIGIVVPKIYFEKGHEFHNDRYKSRDLGKVIWYAGGYMDWKNIIGKNKGVDEVDNGQHDISVETKLATGCCMLIKAEVFKRVGFFDERYFLYYEDTDFSMRVRKNGYKIYYEPEALLWHKNAGSAGGSGSKLQDYFISRNRMLFGMKYAPFRSKFALMRESLNILVDGRNWQKKGIRDFYFRKFGKGSYNFSQ